MWPTIAHNITSPKCHHNRNWQLKRWKILKRLTDRLTQSFVTDRLMDMGLYNIEDKQKNRSKVSTWTDRIKQPYFISQPCPWGDQLRLQFHCLTGISSRKFGLEGGNKAFVTSLTPPPNILQPSLWSWLCNFGFCQQHFSWPEYLCNFLQVIPRKKCKFSIFSLFSSENTWLEQ